MRWTATQLESMLLREVINSAFPNGLSSGLVGKGLGSRFYDSLLLDEWARAWAESGGVGLAEALMEEFQSQPPTAAAPEAQLGGRTDIG